MDKQYVRALFFALVVFVFCCNETIAAPSNATMGNRYILMLTLELVLIIPLCYRVTDQ